MTYKTISQRENIQDKDVANIVDYIERQSYDIFKQDSLFWIIPKPNEYWTIEFDISNAYIHIMEFRDGNPYFKDIINLPTKILADNIVWIYASLRDYYLK